MSSFNAVSVFAILFRELNGELVFLESSVEEGSDSSEFEELVLFGELGESALVEIFVLSDGLS